MYKLLIDISKPVKFIYDVNTDTFKITEIKINHLLTHVLANYSSNFIENNAAIKEAINSCNNDASYISDLLSDVGKKALFDRMTYLCTYVWFELYDYIKYKSLNETNLKVTVLKVDSQTVFLLINLNESKQ